MPVVNNPGTSMALMLPPESADVQKQTEGESTEITQPRTPTSLQGLLRFCMEATKPEDTTAESTFTAMEDERKQFLENALKSMTVDVVEELQKQISILKAIDHLTADDDDDNVTQYIRAIDVILEHIDDIDTANDFHKIGGFMTLYPCIKNGHPKLRSGGCEMIAILCQNNPYCQRIMLENNFVPEILKIIKQDEDMNVVVKALFALSSIVRDNEEGFNQLVQNDGLSILLDTIKRNVEKFIIKSTFLLDSLCRQHHNLKGELITLGYIPCLISLFTTERTPSHEHVLALLVTLIEDNPKAIAECKNMRYNLKDHMQKYINLIKSKEECQEEEDYCKRILLLLNT